MNWRHCVRRRGRSGSGRPTIWDAQMGEGNAFHSRLVAPAAARLLDPQPGETILDVACGNGQFSRQLAALGVDVVAIDFSATFLARAAARTVEHDAAHAARITYQRVDATDEAALLALGAGRFDAAVCNMALMDMPTIAPLLRALRQLLQAGRALRLRRATPLLQQQCDPPHPRRRGSRRRVAGDARRTDRRVLCTSHPARGPGCRASRSRTTTSTAHYTSCSGSASRRASRSTAWKSPSFPPGDDEQPVVPLSGRNYPQIPPALVARVRPLPHGD